MRLWREDPAPWLGGLCNDFAPGRPKAKSVCVGKSRPGAATIGEISPSSNRSADNHSCYSSCCIVHEHVQPFREAVGFLAEATAAQVAIHWMEDLWKEMQDRTSVV